MTDAVGLGVEIDSFAKLVEELRAIASRSDPARRGELVALRRQLADQIPRLRQSGMQAFTDPALSDDFRSRLSRALNHMALHQANWPAVSIGRDDAAYRDSAQQLTEENRSFITWTRAALARQR